jgi:STE24 endopeptidase
VALLLQIIKMGGIYFYVYVWGFMFLFSVFMMTIVPVFIMPLFNKYEPLQEGDLKTQIYALADRLKYPLTKLFVMDGSKRSSHSNAFMFGFGKNKRIGTCAMFVFQSFIGSRLIHLLFRFFDDFSAV